MKKLFAFIIIFSVLFFNRAYAQITNRWIDEFGSEYVVNLDGTVDVKETILFNFGTDTGHGIFRNIGYKIVNQDGESFIVVVENITVTNKAGREIPFQQTKSDQTIDLKIGDPNRTVTGANSYVITYKLLGSLRYFDDHDELYWSPTGNGWDVPILQTNTKIILPKQIVSDINATCFTGEIGSTEKACQTSIKENTVEITTSGVLEASQGITAAISFPKDIIAKLEPQKDEPNLWDAIITLLIVAAISVASLLWYVIYPIKVFLKWLNIYKKDQKAQVVAAWFESPQNVQKVKLTPAETTCIVDNNIDHKDISATLISLAQRGFIKIKETSKSKFSFEIVKDYRDSKDIRGFEKQLLNVFFKSGTVNVANLDDFSNDTTFGQKLTKFKESVAEELVKGGIYLENPEKVNAKFVAIGVLATMSFNFILAGVAFLFGRKAALKTDYGIEALGIAKSLKNFLESQTEQLDFQSKNQMFFEKLLPYATAFGAEKIWAKRFEGLQFTKPEWYEGQNNVFVYSSLVNSLDRGVNSAIVSSSSNRSSSGFSGGFSGGGGGSFSGGSSW